jgi:silicon transporter
MVDACTAIKYTYATGLLIFSIVIVMALIFNEETNLSADAHPAAAFVLIWGALIWLGMIEGGQGALVGLPPVDKDLYKESHPITHEVTTLAHTGDNLDRYLIGRQFMVVITVFCVNISGGPLADAEVLGLPQILFDIFLVSGLAMILMTTQIGQLMSQVNASHMMLDYINTYFMLFTLHIALLIEASGLLHSCYLVQMIFAKLSGKPIESNEAPRTPYQNFFFWLRVLFSLAVLGFSMAVTLAALFQGKTAMYEGVPEAVSVIIFFVLLSVVGMLEGMQIAFFAVTKFAKSEHPTNPVAVKTIELLFRDGGRNLPGFMIGRQMCVTLCFFVAARVTTLDVEVGVDDNIFGVSDGMQEFFNLGFLGAIITTILASITWQLVASAFPLVFLSNPLVYILLRICLFLESTGICSGSWVIAAICKKAFGYQLDTVYIGTAEERLAAADAKQADQLVSVLSSEFGTARPLDQIPAKQLEQALKNLGASVVWENGEDTDVEGGL